MAVTIGSNISALRVQRQLNATTQSVASVSERLASGQRINRASDDAAGLAIASRLGSDQRVYSQAIRNANDGISALNIAQGALSESSTIITRLRELAEQSANGTFTRTQRVTMDKEAQQLVEEYNRIVASTSFNGLNLFAAGENPLSIQMGYGTSGQITFSYSSDINRKKLTDHTVATGYSGSGGLITSRTGDLNGDGRDDIAIYDPLDSQYLQVNYGQADGTFTTGTKIRWNNTITGTLQDFKIMDANADGSNDIVFATSTMTAMKINQGGGSFNLTSTTLGGASATLVSGDFNGDNKTDIFGVTTNTTGIMLLGSGGGFLAAVATTLDATGSGSYQAIDSNGDGKDELTYITSSSNAVVTSYASGKFQTLQTLGSSVTSMATGDIDHNGTIDIIVNKGGITSLLLGTGDGSFGAETLTAYSITGSGSIRDVDGDGIADIVYTYDDGDTTYGYWRKGTGNGEFGAELSLGLGGRAGVLVQLGDFNGDGLVDMVLDNLVTNATAVSNGEDTTSIARQDLTTRKAALATLTYLDTLATNISKALGKIGSAQSRISTSLGVLQASQENFAAAESRIRDTDVAFDAASLTRFQILQQTASALLASANQQPALALRLLRDN
ncbi:MAG: VCBS repeat-containing protein [Deltaproteobacteria bacterium]|nr:VCBS repeat-containing protein [Deltaproteobacteria bacterium]